MALTAKQEAFAQAIVSGMNQSDAYRHAYNASKMKPMSVTVNASKMMADANVALRVETLRKPVIAKLQYGLEQAMAEAADALQVSRDRANGGAMVSAVTLRAKLMGLIIEKRMDVPNPFAGVPIAELEAADAALSAILTAKEASKDTTRSV